jgi:hypothetical protein
VSEIIQNTIDQPNYNIQKKIDMSRFINSEEQFDFDYYKTRFPFFRKSYHRLDSPNQQR